MVLPTSITIWKDLKYQNVSVLIRSVCVCVQAHKEVKV